ncbi:MAG: YfhO family protein, partial [Chloroflexi bacterium]|nr:YfhO family protein [Chloroflexota bacterium]
AAYGLDRLMRRESPRFAAWVGWGALAAGVLLLVVGLPQARAAPLERVQQAMTSVVAAAALLGVSGLLVWLAGRYRWAVWLLPLLLTVDLVGLGSTLEAEPNDPTLGFSHQDVVAFLRQDSNLFRIEAATGEWQPDAALAHGLYDIGGVYNPLELAPYQAYRWAVGERGAPLYNLLGVKYVLAGKGEPLGDERLSPVYTDNPQIDVYLNTAALPRAFLVYRSQVVADHAAAWQAIHAPEFDPAQVVILEQEQIAKGELRIANYELGTASGGQVSFVRYGLNEVELAVTTPVSAFLVLSDVYYPGWRATVDGAPAELLRADYAFRAVPLSPGARVVRLEFAPWPWRAGLAVSVVTWLGVVAWAIVTVRKRRAE